MDIAGRWPRRGLRLAQAGLVLAAIGHVVTYFGLRSLRLFPLLWALVPLLFVVWGMTILIVGKVSRANRSDCILTLVGRHTPPWVLLLMLALAMMYWPAVSVLSMAANDMAVPSVIDGRKVLHSHGRIVRELTDDEYRRAQLRVVRVATGILMVFYGVSSIALHAVCREAAAQRHPDTRTVESPHQ